MGELAEVERAQVAAIDKELIEIDRLRGSFEGAVKVIADLRRSLGMDPNLSPYTVMERYLMAESRFDELKAQAANSNNRDLQQQAIDALPEASRSFLELSRQMYAAGDKYQQDFSRVDSTLAHTQSLIESELDVLKRQEDLLKEIRDKIEGRKRRKRTGEVPAKPPTAICNGNCAWPAASPDSLARAGMATGCATARQTRKNTRRRRSCAGMASAIGSAPVTPPAGWSPMGYTTATA